MTEVKDIFSERKLPWEGLGTLVDEMTSSKEAIVKAGLDWTVVQRDIFVEPTVKIPHMKANVRESDGKVLGIVSEKRYTICQNTDAFEFTDKLLGEGVSYISAGSLYSGRKVWLLARLDSHYILGEEYSPYLVFTNSHDGSGGVRVAVTPVRMFCSNMLNIAFKRADGIWSCNHRGNLQDRLREAANTLGKTSRYMEVLEGELGELSKIKFGKEEATHYISTLLPIKKDDGAKKIETINKQREELMMRYLEAPDLQNLPGGSYRLLNAVSDFAIHAEPIRKTRYYQENLFGNTINGNKMVDKAFTMLREAV